MLHMSSGAWLDKDKDTWCALLDGFLALRALSLEDIVRDVCSENPWENCSTWNVEKQSCKHVSCQGESGADVVHRLQSIHSSITKCKLCNLVLAKYIALVALGVKENIEGLCYTQNPLDADKPPQLSAKRVRRDEDFRTAVLTTAVQENRARSSTAMTRALSDDKARPDKWLGKYILEEQAAIWLATQNISEFVLVFDGGRFGNPAEETLVAGLSWQSENVDHACFLPCQIDMSESLVGQE
eukprot:3086740-Amphidinium_carterae.1